MTAVALGPNILSRIRVQGTKDRKRSGYVDRQHGQIDCPKSGFFETKATYFKTMITTVT